MGTRPTERGGLAGRVLAIRAGWFMNGRTEYGGGLTSWGPARERDFGSAPT